METAKTVNEIYEAMRRKSVLLSDREVGKGRPQCSMPIVGIMGIRAHLSDLTTDQTNEFGYPTGLIASATEVMRLEIKNFKANNRANKDAKPSGDKLESINQKKALVKLLEAEARFCNKVIFEHEAATDKALQEVPLAARIGSTKRNEQGIIVSCDGRAVDSHGKFSDGTDVFKYLDEVLKHRKAKAARAKATAREQRYSDVMPAL